MLQKQIEKKKAKGKQADSCPEFCLRMPGARASWTRPHGFRRDLVSRKVHSRRPREDLSSLTAFVLTSKANGASFYVRPFETPSLQELHAQLGGGVASGSVASTGVGLTFENITGAAKTLHLEPSNAGAVFQVASQFNCLEMVGLGTRPDDGVTSITVMPHRARHVPFRAQLLLYFATIS